MTMSRLGLLGSLRVAFFGAIKAALCAYILFLTDTAFVNSGPESDGHVGGTASYGTGPHVPAMLRPERWDPHLPHQLAESRTFEEAKHDDDA